jgi:hypothetical protein
MLMNVPIVKPHVFLIDGKSQGARAITKLIRFFNFLPAAQKGAKCKIYLVGSRLDSLVTQGDRCCPPQCLHRKPLKEIQAFNSN